jgi:hypothetical protein
VAVVVLSHLPGGHLAAVVVRLRLSVGHLVVVCGGASTSSWWPSCGCLTAPTFLVLMWCSSYISPAVMLLTLVMLL